MRLLMTTLLIWSFAASSQQQATCLSDDFKSKVIGNLQDGAKILLGRYEYKLSESRSALESADDPQTPAYKNRVRIQANVTENERIIREMQDCVTRVSEQIKQSIAQPLQKSANQPWTLLSEDVDVPNPAFNEIKTVRRVPTTSDDFIKLMGYHARHMSVDCEDLATPMDSQDSDDATADLKKRLREIQSAAFEYNRLVCPPPAEENIVPEKSEGGTVVR